MVLFLLLVAFLPCALAKSTISADKLFANTLKRWDIKVRDSEDHSERWKRFVAAKETVDRTARGVDTIENLNYFSVLNDKEYEDTVEPLMRRGANVTVETLMEELRESLALSKRSATVRMRKRNPKIYNYWEKTVGLNPPANQLSCGSCWSFPTVTSIEALYKDQTGEQARFSQQFYIDCTFNGDGCGGGSINDGFKFTLDNQYIRSLENWGYTAEYTPCKFKSDIQSGKDNAFTKLWLTSYIPLSVNEDAFIEGVQISPVAFGSYISSSRTMLSYTKGLLVDSDCERNAIAHAMLLVGYTKKTLRVRNSWGTGWGEGGYANYQRGHPSLAACSFFKSGFAITTTYRREMQYEYCANKKLTTVGGCKESCAAMNKDGETGWTMAVIPTKYHNELLTNMVNSKWPGVKGDNKFNYLWTGLSDLSRSGAYEWEDGFTPVNYQPVTENIGKYGMLNKNTGKWAFKNSLTYKARGLCSRAVTCWDISSRLKNGGFTFSKADLTEGTVAEAYCDSGAAVKGGPSSFSCAGGKWQANLNKLRC